MTGDVNCDRPGDDNCKTMKLQVYVCSMCGEDHETIDCLIVQNLKLVHDSKILSRARQTLPKDFEVKSLADGSTTVISNVRIDQGTQFGPFQAPLSIDLPPAVLFPLKVFGKTLDEGYYLDTTDEECCNWMCLVASASNTREQNLICYDVKQSIYFATTKDVEPGQELRLWYALFYGLKLQALPLSDESTEEGRGFDLIDEEVQTKSNNGNSVIGDSLLQTLTQHLPAHALGAFGERDVWKCKLCGAQETNVASYARHLMIHYRQPVLDNQYPQCEVCFRRFFSKKVLEKHVLQHHNCHEALQTDKSNWFENNQFTEKLRHDKISSLCHLDSNKVNGQEIFSSEKVLDGKEVVSHKDLMYDQYTYSDEKKMKLSDEEKLWLDSNNEDHSHSDNSGNGIEKQSKQYEVSNEEINTAKDCEVTLNLNVEKELNKTLLSSSQISNAEKLVIHSSNGESFSTSYDIRSSQDIDNALENGEPLTFIMVQSNDACDTPVHFQNDIKNPITNEISDLNSSLYTAQENDVPNQEKYEDHNLAYKCDICQKSFSKGAYLYRHLRKHTGEFTCVICFAVFARKENLKTHSCSQPKEWFPCPTCGRKFSAKKYLQRHIPIHTGEFKCSECNRHFVSKLSLKYHRCYSNKNQSDSGPFSCLICERTFCTESKLRAHLKIHPDSKCKPMFMKSSQNTHRQARRKDNNILNNEEQQNKMTEGKLFICEICGAIFKSSSSMKTHRFCHGERKFECNICEKRFHRKDVLQEHSRVHEEANFPCDLCGKKYKTKKSLYVHSLIHEGSKRFSCNVCGKGFFQKGNLIKHSQTHTSSRKYCCQYCKKTFSSKEYFNIHQLTHTQGKIYRCDECKRGFVKKHLLDTHRQSLHSNRGFLCKFCNNLVRHRHSIRRHLEKSHGALRDEWSIPGFIDVLQIEIPANLLVSLGDAKLTPKEQQERQNQIDILRKKCFQKNIFLPLDSSSEYSYTSAAETQSNNFTVDDPEEMLKPSQALALENFSPDNQAADTFQGAVQFEMSSENVEGEDAENGVVFTLVNEGSSHNNPSKCISYPYLSCFGKQYS